MIKRREKVIMIDINDTLLNTTEAMNEELKRMNRSNKNYFTTGSCFNKKGKHYKQVEKVMKNSLEFYMNNVKLTKDARYIISLLEHNRFRVLLVTEITDVNIFNSIKELIGKLLPNFNIEENLIMCKDKSLIRAEYIIDDSVKTLDNCSELMNIIYLDRKTTLQSRYLRATDLGEAYSLIVADMF